MANRSKQKGTAAESAVRDYLRASGWIYAERLPLSGSKDRGDITGVDPGLVIEVKACNAMDLGGWLRELDAEVVNANADLGVVWHKRRGKSSPADWFVTMTGDDFVQLLRHFCGRPFTEDVA